MKDRRTKRQNEAFEFIQRFMRKQNMPRTLSEIGDGLGIASTNGVYKLLEALRSKGYIEREKHTARGLTLIDDAPDPVIDAGKNPRLPIIDEAESH
ncbi:hypothetical protein CRI94_11535 [Longibacter salinarum]|uniref:LexA repressor DNA-binding domain-containing protein n=1 Tax=Longibacter salinarum TaxID=1850348 RepID=A0A2A8CX36_9BACT|nr:winged helix DNA-binding protein [Longibacter salinarum]PEN13265.1 hypothetical protein CRI94_11535 [Longibacter salinarum]